MAKVKANTSENIQLLEHIHSEHLSSCSTEVEQLQKFETDYENLVKKLEVLPNKTSHEALIPLGPLALVPGRLVHTNEILVLLGDNWFVERSAKQAAEIAKRRLEVCQEKLKKAKRSEELHRNWLGQAQQLRMDQDAGKVEILEELTEAEYRAEEEKHKVMVSKYKEQQRQQRELGKDDTGGGGGGDKQNYEDVMKRLDALEMKEKEMDQNIENEDMDEEMSEEEEGEEDVQDDDEEDEDLEELKLSKFVNVKIDSPMISQGQKFLYKNSSKDSSNSDTDKCVRHVESDDASELSDESDFASNARKRRISWADQTSGLSSQLSVEVSSEDSSRIKHLPAIPVSPCEERTEEIEVGPSTESPLGEMDKSSTMTSAGDVPTNATGITATSPQSPSDIISGSKKNGDSSLPRGILKKGVSQEASKAEAEQGVAPKEGQQKQGWRFAPESVEIKTVYPEESLPPALEAEHDRGRPHLDDDRERQQPRAFTYKVVTRDLNQAEVGDGNQPTTSEPRKVSRFKASRMNN